LDVLPVRGDILLALILQLLGTFSSNQPPDHRYLDILLY
jgi:hypothetical protein